MGENCTHVKHGLVPNLFEEVTFPSPAGGSRKNQDASPTRSRADLEKRFGSAAIGARPPPPLGASRTRTKRSHSDGSVLFWVPRGGGKAANILRSEEARLYHLEKREEETGDRWNHCTKKKKKRGGKKSKNTCFQCIIGGPQIHLLLFAQFFRGKVGARVIP